MDALLERIDDSEKKLINSTTYKPNTTLSRNTNAISRQIELVDKELESIKKQVSLSFEESCSLSKDVNSTFHLNDLKDVQEKEKSSDPNRFDAIPSSIKAYIRQEILLLETKLPSMIETVLDKMLSKKIKIYMDKYSKSQFDLRKRPPWNPPNGTDFVDKELIKALESKSAPIKKEISLHHRPTLSTKLKQFYKESK